MSRRPPCRIPPRRLRNLASDAGLGPRGLHRWLIAGDGGSILVYRSRPAVEDPEVAELNRPVLARIASVLVVLLQVLVLDECLLRCVLLRALVGDLLVLSRDLAGLQLVHLLLQVFPCGRFILALGIQLSLQHLGVRQLVGVVRNVVVPAWSGVHLLSRFDGALCFLLAGPLLPRSQLLTALEMADVVILRHFCNLNC